MEASLTQTKTYLPSASSRIMASASNLPSQRIVTSNVPSTSHNLVLLPGSIVMVEMIIISLLAGVVLVVRVVVVIVLSPSDRK